MGRFSPQVLPDAGPSFAENLANALGAGVQSYEGFKAKREAREDRDRTRSMQEDELVLQGIMPPGWTPPADAADPSLVESQPQRPDYVPFDEVMTGPPDETGAFGSGVDPMDPATIPHQQPRSASGHPGGWDPVTRTFARVPPRLPPPITLPSGRVYDQGGQMQRKLAQAMLEKQGSLDLARGEQTQDAERRYQQLRGLIGTPGFEKLTEAIARAAAEDPTAYNNIVGGERPAWRPGSMAETLELHGAQAEQSAAAQARHRAPRASVDPAKRLMARLEDVVGGAIALEKKDGVAEPSDQNAAARAINIIGADPELRAMFDQGKITRDMVWQAVQGYRDSRTLRGKDEDTSWLDDPTPKTTSGKPALNATRLPAADDALLDELDQEYGGDEQKIRTELKRRGFDPDA